MGRDRAVIDDPPTLRLLGAHDAKGRAGAVEHAIHIDIDHIGKCRRIHLIGQGRIGAAPGIVEQNIQPTPQPCRLVETVADCGRIRDVAGQDQRLVILRRLTQAAQMPAQQPDMPAIAQEAAGGGAPDAAARAGDQDAAPIRRHVLAPDHALRLFAKPLDAQAHHLTIAQIGRRFLRHADTGRGAGGDQIAGLQRREPGTV